MSSGQEATIEEELARTPIGLPPDEVYWMLLSFVALEPAEQLAHLPAPVPARDDPGALDRERNPLLALSIALYDYFPAWCRAFGSQDLQGLEFDRTLGAVDAPEQGAGIHCLEELLHGEAWRELRREARFALEDAGLDPHPIPTPLPLRELVRR